MGCEKMSKIRIPDHLLEKLGDNPSEKIRNMIENNNPLDNVMSCQEAAELWNLNPDYIRELCNKGKVKAKNIGKTWIIDKNQPSPKKY